METPDTLGKKRERTFSSGSVIQCASNKFAALLRRYCKVGGSDEELRLEAVLRDLEAVLSDSENKVLTTMPESGKVGLEMPKSTRYFATPTGATNVALTPNRTRRGGRLSSSGSAAAE